MIPSKIAIIGTGTAGSAAALFLSRAGHRVTLFEKVAQPEPVGAGILLQPTGMQVLQELNVLQDVLQYGAKIEQLYCRTHSQKPILNLSYADLHPGLYGIGLHRGVLFKTLFEKVVAEKIEVHCGVEIQSIHNKQLFDTNQNAYGPFDLIVVAEGARSALRQSDTQQCMSAEEYPWGALWFIGKWDDSIHPHQLFQIVDQTKIMMGLLPTGKGAAQLSGDLTVSLFWSLPKKELLVFRNAGLQAWKAQVLYYAPFLEGFLRQIQDPQQLTFASYYDVKMPIWHHDSMVYVGDAAHAMSPQLGQGANLALWDAKVLSDCLSQNYSVAEALQLYSQTRKRHLRYYQWATRFLTPFFQSNSQILGRLRDRFMPAFSRWHFTRQLMTQTLAGVKRGVIRKSLPLFIPPVLVDEPTSERTLHSA